MEVRLGAWHAVSRQVVLQEDHEALVERTTVLAHAPAAARLPPVRHQQGVRREVESFRRHGRAANVAKRHERGAQFRTPGGVREERLPHAVLRVRPFGARTHALPKGATGQLHGRRPHAHPRGRTGEWSGHEIAKARRRWKKKTTWRAK